jgi:ectoine hydroxylase-related dioxygenase (phytanoyl-CoA dioxygenase family)
MLANTHPATSNCTLTEAVERDGFAICETCIDASTLNALCESLDRNTHGQRNLLLVPIVRNLAASTPVRNLAAEILGPQCRAVKGIFFNKTQESNWKVPWHQDLTITVAQRIDQPGFGPWTMKDGVQNVQPLVEVLENVLAVRIHLDESSLENGPLRVIPGSHKFGRLSAEQIAGWDKSRAVSCTIPKGGALLMRPLLLHASSAREVPRPRRVIHLEFTALQLPGGLQWHSKV